MKKKINKINIYPYILSKRTRVDFPHMPWVHELYYFPFNQEVNKNACMLMTFIIV